MKKDELSRHQNEKKTPDDEICTLALVYMTKAEKLENFI